MVVQESKPARLEDPKALALIWARSSWTLAPVPAEAQVMELAAAEERGEEEPHGLSQ